MSTMVISKIDVDVLVQLAVAGPLEASTWRPAVDDPDAFGQALWARNYDVAADEDDDGTVPDYTFEPLPIAISAAEGLRHISFYTYQSAGEPDDWEQSPLRTQLDDLRERLVVHIPDVRNAPWGWGRAELDARADRSAPAVTVERDHTAFDEVVAHFAAVGLPLDTTRAHPPAGMDPRRFLGSGVFPADFHGIAPFVVRVFVDVADAERHFLDVAQRPHHLVHHRTLRWGGVVVSARFGYPDETVDARMRDGLAALCTDTHLGPPDDDYATDAAPIIDGAGDVVATGVTLDPAGAGTHLAEEVVVARTPTERATLAAMVADPDLRSRIEAISTRTHSIVLLRSVAAIGELERVVQRDAVTHTGQGKRRGTQLELRTRDATCGYGTVLVVDKLPSIPQLTWIDDPGHGRAIRTEAARPRRKR